MKVSGLNHVTLAVYDLERSIAFYRDDLGLTLRASWDEGAYLEAAGLWLCLSLDTKVRYAQRPDYTHIAFSVSDEHFEALSEHLTVHCSLWKQNRSEGLSTYFLDPDGHKLEIHIGSLDTRLDHYRKHPEKGVKIYDR